MTDVKRCIFCGQPFSGQKRNFEHIVPRWLVIEADLTSRDMDVHLPGIRRKVGMGRIGLKVCTTCNDEGSVLESQAKAAYVALAAGDNLADEQIRTLLDWLDKMRIGLWLWLIEQSRESVGIRPKFRVNQRIARKDRILLARRYIPGPPMRGLAFYGLGSTFLGAPSSFGMLINNVFLGSASGDFLVLRHIRDVRIRTKFRADDYDAVDVSLGYPNEPKVGLLGGPSVYAQCILPVESFEEYSVPLQAMSVAQDGLAESPILRLDGRLLEWAEAPANVPLVETALRANSTLMNLNVELIEQFILADYMRGDFSAFEPHVLADIKRNNNSAAEEMRIFIAALKYQYFTESGLRLPA